MGASPSPGADASGGGGARAKEVWPSWMEGPALHRDFRGRRRAGGAASASQELEREYLRLVGSGPCADPVGAEGREARGDGGAAVGGGSGRSAVACKLEAPLLGEFRPAASLRQTAQSALGDQILCDADRALLERASSPSSSAAAAAVLQRGQRVGSARPRARPPLPRQRPQSALPAVPRVSRKKAESAADLCVSLADLGGRPEAVEALRTWTEAEAEGRAPPSGAEPPPASPLLRELQRLVRALEARTTSQELTDAQCRRVGSRLAQVGSRGRHALFSALDALGANAIGDFLLLQYNLAKTVAHERVLQRQMADAAIRDRTVGAGPGGPR